MIVWFGYFLIGCALGLFVLSAARLITRNRRPTVWQWPYFDISAARRESHALGLPFPEADGTLSLPEPPRHRKTDAEVRAEIHAHRVVAQLGITAEEAGKAMREAFAPKPITSHMPDGQREGWVAMVRERGWTCSTHTSCDLNTPSCRLVVLPDAGRIADAVICALPEHPTQEVFNDLLAEYFRNR